jgi:hypothetical protein
MCYFLHLATPLTLSEVRSMLPPGITAESAATETRQLKQLFPAGSTIIRLLVGRCSCDFVRPRLPDAREDERHLRQRFRQAGRPRSQTITALERHRRAPRPHLDSPGDWDQKLADFVAEHARNAGPSVYLLTFDSADAGESDVRLDGSIVRSANDARLKPGGWLMEGKLIVVQ